MKDTKRDKKVWLVGFAVSFFLAAIIVAFWQTVGLVSGIAPLAGGSLLGTSMTHSRNWDAFLGLYGLFFASAFTIDDEKMSDAACIGIFLFSFAVDLASFALAAALKTGLSETPVLVAMLCAISAITYLTERAKMFRLGALMVAALAFSYSLLAGALAGGIIALVGFMVYLIVSAAVMVRNETPSTNAF